MGQPSVLYSYYSWDARRIIHQPERRCPATTQGIIYSMPEGMMLHCYLGSMELGIDSLGSTNISILRAFVKFQAIG